MVAVVVVDTAQLAARAAAGPAHRARAAADTDDPTRSAARPRARSGDLQRDPGWHRWRGGRDCTGPRNGIASDSGRSARRHGRETQACGSRRRDGAPPPPARGTPRVGRIGAAAHLAVVALGAVVRL